MYFARTAQKSRGQMVIFSGELSKVRLNVMRRFVAEMVYGIQARGSVRLTEVGRAPIKRISLKKTEKGLSRQLRRKRLDREIQRWLIGYTAPCIEYDTLLVLDLSNVTKKYAEKMEHLARVRNGSEKEMGWGYWTLNIVGANSKGTKIVPLYGRLFSHAVSGHESENEEIRAGGIWVMDQGGERFLIRVRGDRGLRTSQGNEPAVDLARSCPGLFYETVVREEAITQIKRLTFLQKRKIIILYIVYGTLKLKMVGLRVKRKETFRVLSQFSDSFAIT